MRTRHSLEEYLSAFVAEAGGERGEIVKLGRKPSPVGNPTMDQRERLLAGLEKVEKGSAAIFWLWAGMIVAAFVISVGLSIFHRENIGFVTASLVGGTGIIAFLFSQVRSVHGKFVSTQILLAVLPNLPPEEWVKVSHVLLDEVFKVPVESKK